MKSPDPCNSELEQNKVTGRHRNLSQGVADFSKISKRKFHADPKPFQIPDSYDPWKLQRGSEVQGKFRKT